MEEDRQDEGFPFTAVKIEPEDDWQIESEQNEASSSDHTMEKTEPSNADSPSLDEGESSQESDKFSSFTPAVTSNSGCDVPDEEPGTSWSGTIKQEVDSDDEMDSQSSNDPDYGSSYIEGSDNPHWSSLCDQMKAEVEEDNFDDFEPEENFDDSESEEIFEDLEPRDKTSTGNMIIPDGLCIQETKEEDGQKTRKGIWTTKFLSRGLVFGPYADATRTPGVLEVPLDCSWTVHIKQSKILDECNIESCKTGDIFYLKINKALEPGTQLLQAADRGTNKKGRQHICPICSKGFGFPWNLKTHLLLHSGNRPFKCRICGKSFPHMSGLKVHELRHSEDKPHKCPVCDKGFCKSTDYHRHLLVHTGEKPFQCQECGKCFSQSESLKTHSYTHTGQKPYQCPDCGRCFAANSNLRAHQATHTGERPHECPVCQKCFTLASGLKKHRLTHSDEKKHQCTECGKTFSRSDALKYHMLTHSGEKPHQCPKCEKCFALSGTLRSHLITHTGEKRFKCTICEDKYFTLNSSLSKHMKAHRKKNAHKCPVCGVGFSRSGGLHTHMLKHDQGLLPSPPDT